MQPSGLASATSLFCTTVMTRPGTLIHRFRDEKFEFGYEGDNDVGHLLAAFGDLDAIPDQDQPAIEPHRI
jgi:hypothetical protein